ncbi:MAG TPA: Ig-like domain-containing protein [Steroidobacteraceae bacterium]
MNTNYSKAVLRTLASVSLLLAAGLASAATVSVNLTARQMSAMLPDGSAVPMWGYCHTGNCSAVWAPGPTIVAAPGDTLTINLTNSLPIPTSIVILGQYGGGLGAPARMSSPNHAPQSQTTWPGNGAGTNSFTPPAQADRVSSFSTEIFARTTTALTWSSLRPGTYLYETGTLPSIQAPMGLYGVLIVTQAPVLADPANGVAFVPGKAYPGNSSNAVSYDADTSLLFSEIDPLQNQAVDAAAVYAGALANAADTAAWLNKRFDDASCSLTAPCLPAAVNYTPTYFLINGQPFDETAPQKSAFAIAGTDATHAAAAAGNVLVRLVNAGLRTHIPSIVGLPMSIVSEDGNVAPGEAKLQNEVLLTAGKTHDVLVAPPSAAGSYSSSIFPVFDRQLSLSTANQSDGGMQGFLQVASAGAASGPGALPGVVTPTAVNDNFNVPLSASINGNVKLNDIAVATVEMASGPAHGTATLNSDGTFSYTPAATPTGPFKGTDSFTYSANGGAASCSDGITVTAAPCVATVILHVAISDIGPAPTAIADAYNSSVSTRFSSSRPGVLANDSDPSGYPLAAVNAVAAASGTSTACASVALNADGSFSAAPPTGASSCAFTYQAKNSQGTNSPAAAVTVTFVPAGMTTGLNVRVFDPADNADITDYRWIIQEDLTFKVDPTGTPSINTRTLGTSFHRSHMPVVATGCVGPVSCGSGQQGRISDAGTGTDTNTDLNGTLGVRHVLTDADAMELAANPDKAVLDPNKHYYISILPGDAGNGGHGMGGAEIKPGVVTAHTPVDVASNAYDWQPAQLSIFIYEDNAPVNGQNDLNENGLGGFNIILMDPAGRSGDVAGQQSYDSFGMPLSNSLLGRPGCPDDQNRNTNGTPTSDAGNLVGVVYTCPNAPDRGPAPVRANFPPDTAGTRAYQAASIAYDALIAQDAVDYVLAGHALIKNVTPARYDVIAHPAAAREGAGEVWWQTETLEGTPAQDAFTGVKEPVYFQEFGPPGFHTTIGFVNPDRVKKYATDNHLNTGVSISGNITNQRMSRPSDVTLYDAGSYDLLNSSTCYVALNSQGGTGPTIATAECDHDGKYTLTGVPAGNYELMIWDQWLDQIIQASAVTVGASNMVMGNTPVLGWFTQYDQNIFMDTNRNGIYDADKEKGISNVTMTTRYRDGGISNQTATDSNGNGLLAELFPLFNWYVTEADTTRFKQTGVNVIVDGGGPADTTGDGAGIYSSTYATDGTSNRTELPGAYSYGLQGFISQRSTINWGRAPYDPGENGGIQGVVVYSTTRPFDDQRYNVQTLWEPLVPRVTVNLYHKEKLADGTDTLRLVDTTKTSSFDDWVNTVKGSDDKNYLLGQDGVLRNPVTGAVAPAGVTAGAQVNMQCPGQKAADPFYLYTLGGTDRGRCYDGWHNWNQIQAAPYDGRYQFPTANCTGCVVNPNAGPDQPSSPLKILPPGEYVVEAVTPPGFEVVKEEDKNILNGDSFVAPDVQQFAGIGDVFILPDQATLNNANPYNLKTADGIANNATSDLGVTTSSVNRPECVGNLHRVPDFLSLFPSGGLVAPFSGMDRPLCDRKLVKLGDQMQASATFFVFTQVPMAANGAGIILDDATSEFNAIAPDFGEKASVPFVPVSVKDFNGREISRLYSDQWGAYNMLTPSSWLVNPPTPSGYGPNMLITCMNDPGPIRDPVTGQMVTDPQYNAAYSNFCYTLPFMPGRTTYLDTPVLPIAAFAAGYNPADCAYPDATPGIARVDAGGSGNFGPYLPAAGGTLIIKAIGFNGTNDVGVPVANPAYAGPFALTGPSSEKTITRHYGFGTTPGTVKIGNVTVDAAQVSWQNDSLSITVPAGTPTGELVVTAANGKSSVDAVTVTVGGTAPKRVQGANGQTIQAAIDAANPGDLILIDAGTYNELVIMWKPVRLQGVGAASVIVNAARYPTSKLAAWRPAIDKLFAVDPATGNSTATTAIPAQIDALPTQEITGGVVLLEPSVLGSEQGPGITVLAKDLPQGSCSGGNIGSYGAPVTDSNFWCKSSRIDGLSVTGGDSGGGIYVNGWAHNLEISNNRVYGNAGALNGGVRIGVPYLEQDALPTDNRDNIVGFAYDVNVKIHHNAITKNGTVESTAGAGGAGGGVSICSGTDGYSVDHNWICGNFSASDGGGIGHIGYSQGGKITGNQVLFNQTFQQTGSTHGGGITVTGEPAAAGVLSLGTGNVTIDSNVIRGNSAEGGHGGGIRLQQVNGADVTANPRSTNQWFKATVTNNIIDNNVAGYSGGGISMADTLVSVLDNNTIASNDSVGIAGTVLAGTVPLPAAATGVAGTGKPSPAGISSERTSAQLVAALNQAPLSATKKAISSPELVNNILWKNRSFFYKSVAGNGTLCSSNSVADASGTTCDALADQITTTGQCMNTAAGVAPKYWDLGVVGDASSAPGPASLSPTFSVLTSTGGYTTVSTTTSVNILFATHVSTTVTVSTGAVHGFSIGQSVTIAGMSSNRYNGTFTITAVPDANQFRYVSTSTNAQLGLGALGGTATGSAAAATGNIGSDPMLADMYCNGSRVTPEYPSVINPPGANNMQAAATVDEGNNYVTLRYGPLYSSKPTTPAGTAFTPFGDLHIGGASPAKDSGTPLSAIDHDIDGDRRGPGNSGVNGAYDRGADEIADPAPIAGLSVTTLAFGNQLLNSISAAATVTVNNTGTAPLVFNAAATPATAGLSISGNFAIAAAGTTCVSGGTVAAGGSCSINVTFNPIGSAGAKAGTLTLRDNAGTGTQTVSLTGTATQRTVSFTSVSLGNLSTLPGGQRQLAFGDLSGTQTSTVTLTASNGPVLFGTASVSNDTGSFFTKGADTCSGATVAAGSTCTIIINFAAPITHNTNNPRIGTLSVPDNAAGTPQTLRLTGS